MEERGNFGAPGEVLVQAGAVGVGFVRVGEQAEGVGGGCEEEEVSGAGGVGGFREHIIEDFVEGDHRVAAEYSVGGGGLSDHVCDAGGWLFVLPF